MVQKEAFIESAFKSASRRINEVVLMPEFAVDYQDHALQMALADNDRPFGVVYLESIDLFHFVHAIDAHLKGERTHATDQASIAFAYLKLAAETYFSDLNYLSSQLEDIHTVGGSLMLMGLTRTMLQGYEELTTFWSSALRSAMALHGELIREQVPDEGLAAHIELAAKCWLENRWAQPSEIDESLGPYRLLWAAKSDIDFHLALQEMIAHHFREISMNELTPLAGLCYLAWPSEVLALVPLYRRLRNPKFDTRHDAYPKAWQNLDRVPTTQIETTSTIRRKAKAFYGTSWVPLSRGA